MLRAVFLDRDGVINQLVFNKKTSEFESPHEVESFEIIPKALDGMKMLLKKGFELFVVSNQPSYAKGKTTLENIRDIALKLEAELKMNHIHIQEFYYCFHHPEGRVTEYTQVCDCRKPKPGQLLKAAQKYKVDLKSSWMIGDQDSDILCGQAAGCKTVLIENPDSKNKRGKSRPTFVAQNLYEACEKILGEHQ